MFQDIIEKVGLLECDERRSVSEDYCEVVIPVGDSLRLNEILTSYFGPPLKREGEEPSLEAERYSGAYGGVRTDQTLYLRHVPSGLELALIWPWSSGVSLTVKLIRNH